VLGAHGSPRVADERDVELLLNGLPLGSFAVVLASKMTASVQNPGNTLGELCLGGTVLRSVPLAVSEHGAARVNLSEVLAPVGLAPQVGETWYYQAIYRDVLGSQPVTRLSPAVSMTFR